MAHSVPSTRDSIQADGGFLRSIAGTLSRSFFLRRGAELWERNQRDWNLPLTKVEKLLVTLYIISRDYSKGIFPPTFLDQQKAYENEINYSVSLPGVGVEQVSAGELRKPFWFGHPLQHYLNDFLKLTILLKEAELSPPAKLLELGGGSGWTADFLTQLGFDVLSTTISPGDIKNANKRLDSLKARGLECRLRFQISPMETVNQTVEKDCPFDGVFVYEALHHAFDWKAAVASAFGCLRFGGWLLICGEPNILHTAASYRVAKLSSTHEVGFRRRELVDYLRKIGFRKVVSRGKIPSYLIRPHWIMAQR